MYRGDCPRLLIGELEPGTPSSSGAAPPPFNRHGDEKSAFARRLPRSRSRHHRVSFCKLRHENSFPVLAQVGHNKIIYGS
jgi:hypothetical protein